MKYTIKFLLLILLMGSCNQKQASRSSSKSNHTSEEIAIPITRQASPPPPPQASIQNNEVIKKKIIKDGRIGIEVHEFEQAKSQIDSLVAKYDGYYANESLSNSTRGKCYNLTIRIPSNNFEKLIQGVENNRETIKYKEIEARDVTKQFYDLETRLAQKKNYLKRYNHLLKQAKTIKDILEIEEKIRRLDEEIESTTGSLKYLSDLVNYSTLNLEISKAKVYIKKPVKKEVAKRFKQSLSKGLDGVIDFIAFVIKLWPFIIIVGLILFYWKTYRKRRSKK